MCSPHSPGSPGQSTECTNAKAGGVRIRFRTTSRPNASPGAPSPLPSGGWVWQAQEAPEFMHVTLIQAGSTAENPAPSVVSVPKAPLCTIYLSSRLQTQTHPKNQSRIRASNFLFSIQHQQLHSAPETFDPVTAMLLLTSPLFEYSPVPPSTSYYYSPPPISTAATATATAAAAAPAPATATGTGAGTATAIATP